LHFADKDNFARLDPLKLGTELANAGGDAAKGIDAWLNACTPDVDWQQLLANRELLRFSQSCDGDAISCLLLIHCLHINTFHLSGLPNRLDRLLKTVEKDSSFDTAIIDYLKSKCVDIVSSACDRAISEGCLRNTLEGAQLLVDKEWIIIIPGGRVSLEKAICSLSGDGMDLWSVRSAIKEGVELFDAAVSAEWKITQFGIREAVIGLFQNGFHPSPAAMMKAFPETLQDKALLHSILKELYRRQNLYDGFNYGAKPNAWLQAVALSLAWQGEHMRLLLELEQLLDAESNTFLETARIAIGLVWLHSQADAVYGALTMLRHARRIRESHRHFKDVEEEGKCIAFLETLDAGGAVVWLHRHCNDLPLDDKDVGYVWSFLPKNSKGYWRWMIASRVKEIPELRRGLLEFLISWTPRNVYTDLERLVVDLIVDAKDRKHLRAISEVPRRVAVIRAGALDIHLDGLGLMD